VREIKFLKSGSREPLFRNIAKQEISGCAVRGANVVQRELRGECAARLRQASLSESSSARQVKSSRAARRGFWAAHDTPISVSLAFFAPLFLIGASPETYTDLANRAA
jgi:hypothetical protein